MPKFSFSRASDLTKHCFSIVIQRCYWCAGERMPIIYVLQNQKDSEKELNIMSEKKDELDNSAYKAVLSAAPNELASSEKTVDESTDHINKGDREAPPSASIEEMKEQVAVAYQEFGSDVEIPAYFTIEDKETGEEKALHHVKDAEEISDVIRQARVNEDGARVWN
jgi:hypothetical protein